jgi:hypothetical protein
MRKSPRITFRILPCATGAFIYSGLYKGLAVQRAANGLGYKVGMKQGIGTNIGQIFRLADGMQSN